MKLIHEEIDVVPENTPSVSNLGSDIRRAGGSAQLNLVNDSPAINTFHVWVRSSDGSKLERFASLQRLDQGKGQGEVADVPDKGGRYVAQAKPRDTRKLAVAFRVPKDPAVRAGVYALSVEAEATEPVGSGPFARKRASCPVRIVVRPFYDWTISMRPKEQFFGVFRRRRTYYLEATNRGNDWLYLDIAGASEAKNLRIEIDTGRIAVAPAQSKEHATVRLVPVRVYFKGKGIIGSPTPTPIPVVATRVDAPSVARFPEQEGVATVQSLNLGDSVLVERAAGAGERKTLTGVNAVYRPPIPRTIPDLISAVKQGALMILALFLMGSMALLGASLLWSSYQREVEVKYLDEAGNESGDRLPTGRAFYIAGDHLRNADVAIYTDGQENTRFKISDESGRFKVQPPPDFTTDKLVARVHRPIFFGFKLPLIHYKDGPAMKLGATPFKVNPPNPTYRPGDKLTFKYTGEPSESVTADVGGKNIPLSLSGGVGSLQIPSDLHGDINLNLNLGSAQLATFPLHEYVAPVPEAATAGDPAGAVPGVPSPPSEDPTTGGSSVTPSGGTGATPRSAGSEGGTQADVTETEAYTAMSQAIRSAFEDGKWSGIQNVISAINAKGGAKSKEDMAIVAIGYAAVHNWTAFGGAYDKMNDAAEAYPGSPYSDALYDAANAAFEYQQHRTSEVGKWIADLSKTLMNKRKGGLAFLLAATLDELSGNGLKETHLNDAKRHGS